MKKLNVAIIGCGAIGSTHAKHYAQSPYGQMTAFVDIIPERAQKFAADHGGTAAVYTDYRKMLKDSSIDAVSVCLPNALHAPVSIAALKAGKHVLCEKPIALNTAQAEAMRAAARAARKTLAIGVVNRYNGNVNWIRDMIAAGDLGEVYHVNAQFRSHRSIPGLGGWFTTKKEAGGGVMFDWGVHFIDLILYCLGVPKPLSVSGVAHAKLAVKPKDYAFISMWAGPPKYDGVCDVEEYVSGLVRTKGPSIAFEGAWAQNIGESAMFIDFLGDKAGVRLAYGGSFTVYGHKDGRLYKTEPSMRADNMFQVEIDTFLQSATTGKRCASDIDSVIPTQKILDGLYRSSKMGREVKL